MPLLPEIAALLERQRDQPRRSSLTVQQTRSMMLRIRELAGDAPPVTRVFDRTVAGSIRTREYRHAEDLPLILYFHGGRFFSGDLDSHDVLCRWLAIKSMCRVVAVDYRLAPEHPFPAAVDDACCAVAWALQDSDRVAVAGDSAGANLAAVAALAHRHALRCQLLIYPMIDPACATPSHREFATGYGPGSEDMARGWREYLREDANPHDWRVSPLNAVDCGGLPPTLVLTAEYDTLRDEGEDYVRRLRDAAVRVELRRYPGTIHGFAQFTGFLEAAHTAIYDAARFLRTECSRIRPSPPGSPAKRHEPS